MHAAVLHYCEGQPSTSRVLLPCTLRISWSTRILSDLPSPSPCLLVHPTIPAEREEWRKCSRFEEKGREKVNAVFPPRPKRFAAVCSLERRHPVSGYESEVCSGRAYAHGESKRKPSRQCILSCVRQEKQCCEMVLLL